ncbi:hypothetical protein MRX96_018876 [Rhipicephalus microplus]
MERLLKRLPTDRPGGGNAVCGPGQEWRFFCASRVVSLRALRMIKSRPEVIRPTASARQLICQRAKSPTVSMVKKRCRNERNRPQPCSSPPLAATDELTLSIFEQPEEPEEAAAAQRRNNRLLLWRRPLSTADGEPWGKGEAGRLTRASRTAALFWSRPFAGENPSLSLSFVLTDRWYRKWPQNLV